MSINKITRTLKLDSNVIDAIKTWFWYGFYPGSFTKAVIEGNMELAEACAHPLIKECIDDHICFARNYLPDEVKNMVGDWQGYNNLNEKERKKIPLTEIIKKEFVDKL